ncbi:unnamed protein product [Prorocentrum cordatum]|uniref:Uncharacterized protein n=1 Tax=Prorocentrum cordatum TaxID=2364126 RepID=A0ABN9W4H4_9DINO|nr:unnamed protein product [Polarella glacialis]
MAISTDLISTAVTAARQKSRREEVRDKRRKEMGEERIMEEEEEEDTAGLLAAGQAQLRSRGAVTDAERGNHVSCVGAGLGGGIRSSRSHECARQGQEQLEEEVEREEGSGAEACPAGVRVHVPRSQF